MDNRFENQDRMINYLLQQIQGLEITNSKSLKNSNEIAEREREQFSKRSIDLKIQNDSAMQQLADLHARTNALAHEQ